MGVVEAVRSDRGLFVGEHRKPGRDPWVADWVDLPLDKVATVDEGQRAGKSPPRELVTGSGHVDAMQEIILVTAAQDRWAGGGHSAYRRPIDGVDALDGRVAPPDVEGEAGRETLELAVDPRRSADVPNEHPGERFVCLCAEGTAERKVGYSDAVTIVVVSANADAILRDQDKPGLGHGPSSVQTRQRTYSS